MRLPPDVIQKWETIVDNVDKDHIPIDCVKKIIFKLNGRPTQKTFNIANLRKQGLDEDEIQVVIERAASEYGPDLRTLEFILDVEAVAEILQPETDELLRGIQ